MSNNTWTEFIEMLDISETSQGSQFNKNLKTPKGLMKLIKEDKALMEEKEDRYISLMEFLNILLMIGGNYNYNAKTKEYYRSRNGNNLSNYYKEKEGAE